MTEPGLLDGDFNRFEDLLDGREREKLHALKDFLAKDVAPIANRYWNRAEFPFEVIPGLAALNIAGTAYDEVPGDAPSALLAGFLALEMTHTDPSVGTFFGVHSGLAMGSIAHCGGAEQRAREINTLIVGRAITGLSAFV